MKILLVPLIALLALDMTPVFSHGSTGNCSQECNDYYCPPEHFNDNKNNARKYIPLKRKSGWKKN